MDYLGLLCLGTFVGAIATRGLEFATGLETWQQMLTVIFSATFTSAAVAFIDRFRSARAFGAYSVGLLVALLWAYAGTALQNVTSEDETRRLLGWLQIAGVSTVTLLAAALFMPPAFKELWNTDRKGNDAKSREDGGRENDA